MKFVAHSLAALVLLTVVGCVSAESRMETGDTLFRRGNYTLALEHYRAAQRKDPTLIGVDQKIHETEVRILLQRGDSAVQRGDWATAERVYAEVRRADPANAEVEDHVKRMAAARANDHFRRGQQLLGRGNPFDAIGEFEQALTFQPEHPRAAEGLDRAIEDKVDREAKAETAFQAGLRARAEENLEEAVRQFSTALNVNPHHPSAEQELDDAKGQYAESLSLQGDAAMSRKEWHQAVDFYRKAQSYNRRLPGLMQRIRRARREARATKLIAEGNQAFDLGDWRVAFERFGEARELSSSNEKLVTRYRTARKNLAAQIYGSAQEAERDGRIREALNQYRSIAEFYRGYRDVKERTKRLDQRLQTAERSYAAGCRARDERDLLRARDHFRTCAEAIPDHEDVATQRRLIDEAVDRAESIYERACQAQARNDYVRARVLFEECVAITSPFRDVAERLTTVRDLLVEQAALDERYEEACRAFQARDLEQARRLFVSCQRSQSEYRDVAIRLQQVENALKSAYGIYERAVRAEERCVLDRARTLYEEALAVSRPCRDAEDRLKRIDGALERLEEAERLERDRNLREAQARYRVVLERYGTHAEARQGVQRIDTIMKQLATGYEAMVEAQAKGNYSLALTYAREIRKKCVGFNDVDERFDRLESEVDYADGCTFEAEERYDEAVRAFERCVKRTPRFRDVQERLRSCRDKKATRSHRGDRGNSDDRDNGDDRRGRG